MAVGHCNVAGGSLRRANGDISIARQLVTISMCALAQPMPKPGIACNISWSTTIVLRIIMYDTRGGAQMSASIIRIIWAAECRLRYSGNLLVLLAQWTAHHYDTISPRRFTNHF